MAFRPLFNVILLSFLWAGSSAIADSTESPDAIPYSLFKTENVTIAPGERKNFNFKVSTLMVEAPYRSIDLPLLSTPSRLESQPSLFGVGLNYASGFDLAEYSVIVKEPAFAQYSSYGLEFNVDTNDDNTGDLHVRAGNPSYFADMLKSRIDFSAHNIQAISRGYKLARFLGRDVDEAMRYQVISGELKKIEGGVADVNLNPGGSLIIRKFFSSFLISSQPWVQFDFELPNTTLWSVQINAKIDQGSLKPLSLVQSDVMYGSGKSRIVFDLRELLKRADASATDGRLTDLYIIFTDAAADQKQPSGYHINLGHLGFYTDTLYASNGQISTVLAAGNLRDDVGIADSMMRLTPDALHYRVVSGKFIAEDGAITASAFFPDKVTLRTDYHVQVPKLFVRDSDYLSYVNADELSEILDQKLFINEKILKKLKFDDGVLIKNRLDVSSENITNSVNLEVAGNVFIKPSVHVSPCFLHEMMHVEGVDIQGKVFKNQYLMQDKIIKVDAKKVNSISLPSMCKDVGLLLASIEKTKVYNKTPDSLYVDTDEFLQKPLWRAFPKYYDTSMYRVGSVHIVDGYRPMLPSADVTYLKYEFELTNVKPRLFFRFTGRRDNQRLTKVEPIQYSGSVRLPEMQIDDIELLAILDSIIPASVSSIFLKKLELFDSDSWLAKAMPQPSSRSIKLDASLSFDEVQSGGKVVATPPIILPPGEHAIRLFSPGSNFDVSLIKDSDPPPVPSIAPTFSSIILSMFSLKRLTVLFFFSASIILVWKNFLQLANVFIRTNLLIHRWPRTVVSSMVGGLLVLLLFSLRFRGFDALTGFLTVALFSSLVRCKLRSLLAEEWQLFSKKLSAPYFVCFLFAMAICTILLLAKLDDLSKIAATLGYFLFIFGVVVEFIQFARSNPKLST